LKTQLKIDSDKTYRDCCYPGTHYSEQWLSVTGNVTLKVVVFTPSAGSKYNPVIFIAGLASMIEGFQKTLIELTRDFQVYYVDTRERSSSRISGKVSFDMETFSSDISSVVTMLGLEDKKYSMFGYSLGATVIVDAQRYLGSKPDCALLLEPNATFNYPRISLAFMRLNLPLFYLMKPLVKAYIRQFRINRKEDNDMYLISARSLDNAHPRRLRKTVLGIASYKIWDKLEYVTCPTLVVGTSKDHFHSHDDVKRMIDNLKDCTYIDLENNRRTHSAELGIVIRKYIDSLKSNNPDHGTDI
jgi:pimeloyl-ACP methyl ester carboxylesterase